MIKKGIFYIAILVTVVFISSGFKPYNPQINDRFRHDKNDRVSYVFPSKNYLDYVSLRIPFTGKFFIGFKEAVAHKESQGKYQKINSLGYMGKYQFGSETLKSIFLLYFFSRSANNDSYFSLVKLSLKCFRMEGIIIIYFY